MTAASVVCGSCGTELPPNSKFCNECCEVSPSELLEAAIERIERIDPALNAVVIRWFDHARETTASADLPNGPFRGVPFLIKDLFASPTRRAPLDRSHPSNGSDRQARSWQPV